MNATPRVVIVGGGVAGLETAFTLRSHLGGRVELVLIAADRDFLFKPNTVYIPFGGAEADSRIPLAVPTRRRGIELVCGSLAHVDPHGKHVELADGTSVPYDFLVLATGAAMRPEEIPGLAEHARTIWTPAQMRSLGAALDRVRSAAESGTIPHVLFLVPPGNGYAGPLYEIALMLETWLRRRRLRDRVCVTFATFESSFFEAFGPRFDRVVRKEFAERGIIGCTGQVVTRVEPNRVVFANGTARTFDLLISFPPHTAAVDYPDLATDERGFLRCEPANRRVLGADEVYAPGDAGDFPIKQAFLASLQADAVADDIASRIAPDAVPSPRRFDPVGRCVVEMLGKAAFAQAPLAVTGEADRPVRVRIDAHGDYLVGISPIWSLGKKVLGRCLPRRFRSGRPLHWGLPWQTMELGLRGMAKTLAPAVKE